MRSTNLNSYDIVDVNNTNQNNNNLGLSPRSIQKP